MNNRSIQDSHDHDDEDQEGSNDDDDDGDESIQPHTFSTVTVNDSEVIQSTPLVVDDGTAGVAGGYGDEDAVMMTIAATTTSAAPPSEVSTSTILNAH